jgi:hypothetical protein
MTVRNHFITAEMAAKSGFPRCCGRVRLVETHCAIALLIGLGSSMQGPSAISCG